MMILYSPNLLNGIITLDMNSVQMHMQTKHVQHINNEVLKRPNIDQIAIIRRFNVYGPSNIFFLN